VQQAYEQNATRPNSPTTPQSANADQLTTSTNTASNNLDCLCLSARDVEEICNSTEGTVGYDSCDSDEFKKCIGGYMEDMTDEEWRWLDLNTLSLQSDDPKNWEDKWKKVRPVREDDDGPCNTGRTDPANVEKLKEDLPPAWRFITPNESERNDGHSRYKENEDGECEEIGLKTPEPEEENPIDSPEHESYKDWTRTVRKNKQNEWFKDDIDPQCPVESNSKANMEEKERIDRVLLTASDIKEACDTGAQTDEKSKQWIAIMKRNYERNERMIDDLRLRSLELQMMEAIEQGKVQGQVVSMQQEDFVVKSLLSCRKMKQEEEPKTEPAREMLGELKRSKTVCDFRTDPNIKGGQENEEETPDPPLERFNSRNGQIPSMEVSHRSNDGPRI